MSVTVRHGGARMSCLLALLALTSLCLGSSACGGSSKETNSQGTSNAPSTGTVISGTTRNDRDNDGDHNDDDEHVLGYGHAANAADNHTITALVTHYYAAAAAEDGASACSLLVPFIAESVAENYGHTRALRGKTCTAVMSKLFKQRHQELASKNAALKVIRVGIEGNRSLVAVYFPAIPEVRQVTVRHSGNSWKMLTLLDGILE